MTIVSFLNQLKSQANALLSDQGAEQIRNEANMRVTEAASTTAWLYIAELAKHLNVIEPPGPALSLDGITPWPPMKLADFHVDARKKQWRDQEVFNYISMGWRIVPRDNEVVATSVSANFPPALHRIESRLFAGTVKHQRIDVRHPEKNTLQEIRFDYVTEARASVTISAHHDDANLAFRLANVHGFEVVKVSYSAEQIQGPLLDEMAKLLMGQPSRFV